VGSKGEERTTTKEASYDRYEENIKKE